MSIWKEENALICILLVNEKQMTYILDKNKSLNRDFFLAINISDESGEVYTLIKTTYDTSEVQLQARIHYFAYFLFFEKILFEIK